MIAISAKNLPAQQIIPALFIWLLELTPYSVGLLIQLHAHDCRVMIRDLDPLAFIFQTGACAADLFDGALTDHIGSRISLVGQDMYDSRR